MAEGLRFQLQLSRRTCLVTLLMKADNYSQSRDMYFLKILWKDHNLASIGKWKSFCGRWDRENLRIAKASFLFHDIVIRLEYDLGAFLGRWVSVIHVHFECMSEWYSNRDSYCFLVAFLKKSRKYQILTIVFLIRPLELNLSTSLSMDNLSPRPDSLR